MTNTKLDIKNKKSGVATQQLCESFNSTSFIFNISSLTWSARD